MRITLIEPAVFKRAGMPQRRSYLFQPLTLARLAGLTPPGVEVEAVDDRVDEIDYDAPRDLVGISMKTWTAQRAYQIAAEFRKRGVPVVVGGFHPSLIPDEAAQHADCVVVGEAEGVWGQVVEDARAGRMRPRYDAERGAPFVNVPTDRTPLEGKGYLPVTLVEVTRGCPFDCSYCSVTTLFGGKFRHRTVEEVVQEVESTGCGTYIFTDDNIVGDRSYAKELLAALVPLGIRWYGQASLTVARDPELLRLMRESGCFGLLIGIESISHDSLEMMGKSWNEVGVGYDEALKILRDNGLPVFGSFIIGADGDTLESLDELLEFTIRHKMSSVLFNTLFPYPGTRQYEELKAAGRLLHDTWWLNPDFRYGSPAYRPLRMTPEELTEKRMEMYRRFYGARTVAYRMMDLRANARNLTTAISYLSLNLPALRDVERTLGRRLGGDEP
jgi:radical SAM superfamily enzyme YgiQ (UPF0313 family)